MEASQDLNSPAEQAKPEAPTEASEQKAGPTAKEMAAIEEANAKRAQDIIKRQQALLAAEAEQNAQPTLIEAAAGGIDALHEAMRKASEVQVPAYVPPPRTERQMTSLQAELAAGKRAGERAREQNRIAAESRARTAAKEKAKEGFTLPVYRPGDVVPDPTIPAINSVAGTRQFGKNAP